MNLTFDLINIDIDFSIKKRKRFYNIDSRKVKTKDYDYKLRPDVLEFQLINGTENETGYYWFDGRSKTLKLKINCK